MEILRCIVHRITFHNEENGWTVMKGRVQGYDDPIAFVGTMGRFSVGSSLSVKGEWKNDSKYGKQFSVSECEELMPATIRGIEKYLGSGLIKGIGPKYAKRIVRQFSAETFNIIEDTPDRLIEVEGLGQNRVDMIKEAWVLQKEVKNIMLFLQEHDVGNALAFRISLRMHTGLTWASFPKLITKKAQIFSSLSNRKMQQSHKPLSTYVLKGYPSFMA